MNFPKGLGLVGGTLWLGLTCPKVWAQKPPSALRRFVRTSLAGTRLNEKRTFAHFDSQERYYLLSMVDGLGRTSLVRLLLCPTPKQFGYDFADPDDGDARALGAVRQARLPRLRTGSGVNIGDTPRQVQLKLGAPQEQYSSKTKGRLWVYRAPRALALNIEGQRVRWDYKASYTFRQGRLWAIEYVAQDPDVL